MPQHRDPFNLSLEVSGLIKSLHLSVLEQCNWVIEDTNGAAHILNLQPSTLRYRIKKLGIKKPAAQS